MSRFRQGPYEARARRRGLPPAAARESWRLSRTLAPIGPRTVQADDLAHAYQAAHRLAPGFQERVARLQAAAGGTCLSRPGGVKSLERTVEKYLRDDLVPLDILACKCVLPTLAGIYAQAHLVEEIFPVVGFKDRFVFPQATGYADLQFVVDAGGGHLAEVMVVHEILDALDVYEHRIYEVRRAPGLGVAGPEQTDLQNAMNALVSEGIVRLSEGLYKEAWRMVLEREAGA